MNRHPLRLRAVVSGITTALLVLFAGSISAQVSNTTTVNGVEVNLALDKTEIVAGEPIVLTVTLKNVSQEAIVDIGTNFQLPEGNDLKVMVQSAGELPYRYPGALDAGIYPALPMQLIIGRPVEIDVLLLYDPTQPTGYLFGKPGTYKLAAELNFRLRKSPDQSAAVLPTTTITVAQPTGAEQEVFQLLDEPTLAKALHQHTITTTATLEAMETAASKYPGTPLGSLAMRATGHLYITGTPDERERGAMVLQDYLAGPVAPINADNATWTIAAAYHINKDYEIAREWIRYLARHHPDSPRIVEQDPLVYYYILAPYAFARAVPWYLLEKPWIVPGVEPPTDLSARKVD